MSATPDNTLVDPEQLIADLQRQLSECKAESDEALQRETATVEVLQVINSSPGNLAPVFEAILERALRVCSATFGIMASHDNGRLTRVAARGIPAAFNNWRLEHPLETPSVGYPPSLQRLLAGEAVVHELDLKASEAYREGNPNERAIVDLGGARSVLTVALRNDDALHGVIVIFRQEVRPFSDKEIRLLQNFAAQAVIAMENARLLDELRQRTAELTESLKQQTATSEVLGVISRSPGELQPVFEAMLRNAVQLCDAKFGHIYRWDGDSMRLVAAHNTPPAFAEERRRTPLYPAKGPPVSQVIATKAAVHIDVATLQGYVDRSDADAVTAVELGGMRMVLMVPMLRRTNLSGHLRSIARSLADLPTSRLPSLQTSLRRPSSPSRMLGCWTHCVNAPIK